MVPQETDPCQENIPKLALIKKKFLHSDGFFYTLMRSSLSSQICGWIDTFTGFLVFALFNLSAWLSTAIGAFVGGVCNCYVNYRFTFHAYGVDWRAALAKFACVWTGSLLLNSFGTQIVYKLIADWDWLHDSVGISNDMTFLVARLMVALSVSICWNFLLQRNFVFKETRVDPYINRFLDWCVNKVRKNNKNNDVTRQQE